MSFMGAVTSHESEEWYTPKRFVDMARAALGGIDLDPASAKLPQSWIKAARFYTIADNGLAKPWHGRIWLNPPYGTTASGASNAEIWSKKLIAEHDAGNVTAAIMLINSKQGYNWYESLWRRFYTCQVRERIKFIDITGHFGGQAKVAQTFVYLGDNPRAFTDVFRPIGRIIPPESELGS